MSRRQLISGGEILTMEKTQPKAEAVALQDGIILALGSRADCQYVLDDDFEEINLAGNVLLPGFIDTHTHPLMMIYYDMNVDLRGVRSMGEVGERLARVAAERKTDEWILGLDFDEQTLDEVKLPDRHDLDKAVPEHPAVLIKHDGHMLIANSRAIELAGITAKIPDPPGGIIDRLGDGSPAGPFRESAGPLIKNHIPFPPMERLVEGAGFTARRIASHGITSLGGCFQTDAEGPLGESGAFELMAMSMLLDYFPISIYGMLFATQWENLEPALSSSLNDKAGHRHIGALKLIADGSFGSHTAYMKAPFSDSDTRGIMLLEEDELYRRMRFAHEHDMQIAVHAIGDLACRRMIDLFDRLLKAHPREDHRHRIEHASILDAGMLADMRRLGLCVSTQPLFIQTEKNWLRPRLGPERIKHVYPFRDIIDAGIRLAGASDAPVESIDVLQAIECCISREGFETHQCISAEEALRMYTTDAAWLQFEEDHKGSIAPGKRADLIVLERNPLKVPTEEISKIRVLRTLVAGEEVYSVESE